MARLSPAPAALSPRGLRRARGRTCLRGPRGCPRAARRRCRRSCVVAGRCVRPAGATRRSAPRRCSRRGGPARGLARSAVIPGGSSSLSPYCTGGTRSTSPCASMNVSRSARSSAVVHGVNVIHVGRTASPAASHASSAGTRSAAVWPLSSSRNTSSLVASNAEVTNRQPRSRSRGNTAACSSRCSTFVVTSKVSEG